MTDGRYGGAVSATLAGIRDRLRPARVEWGALPRLDGRSALVTGASGGLGLAIARGLGALGADVTVAVRRLGPETVAAVRAAGAPGARALPVELEDLATVDALARAVGPRRVDLLVLNAGMVAAGARQTRHGLDVMLQVNAVASARLVDRLLDVGALAPGDPAPRIVIVGSEAHRSSPLIDWARLGEPRAYTTRGAVAEYGRSKLVLHTWACELARRLAPGIVVAHMCPGAVASGIAREAPGWALRLLDPVMRWTFQPPDVAARPAIALCAAPGLAPGTYTHLGRARDPSPTASDPAQGRLAWDALHDLLDGVGLPG